jgi:hypothetical protein
MLAKSMLRPRYPGYFQVQRRWHMVAGVAANVEHSDIIQPLVIVRFGLECGEDFLPTSSSTDVKVAPCTVYLLLIECHPVVVLELTTT